MAKRPKISEDLHQFVHEIHEEYTGSSASSFERALTTVVKLAETEILDHEDTEPGWYPGKYASEIAGKIANMKATSGRESEARNIGDERVDKQGITINPAQQAVFKAVLGANGEIQIPEPERRALDLNQGQVLQIVAYPVDSDEESQ